MKIRSVSSRPRRCGAVLAAALFVIVLGRVEAGVTTITALSASLADVQSAIASAKDGDTVIVPAGSANWTSSLTITKGVTLRGATTVTGTAASPTVTDNTTIVDAITNRSGNPAFVSLFNVTLTGSQTFRLTGVTLQGGGSSQTVVNGGSVRLDGSSSTVRIDHCHFKQVNNDNIGVYGSTYGVIDHNVLDMNTRSLSVDMFNGDTTGSNGDSAWAAPTNWGGSNFMFFEDNTVNNPTTTQTIGSIDCHTGGRYVARYSQWNNALPNTHGTQTRDRSARAIEVYKNNYNFTYTANAGQIRGGTALIHDNVYGGSLTAGTILQTFRDLFAWTIWGGTTGVNANTSLYDVNDSHGAYYTGTVGTATTPSGTSGTITDSGSPSWTTNQWQSTAGYSYIIVNNSVVGTGTSWTGSTYQQASVNLFGFITSNTPNQITFNWINFGYGPVGGNPTFSAGNSYSIYKVLVALDQPGRGQGDLLVRDSNGNPTVVAWPHDALEPVYAWNNTHNGSQVGVTSSSPTVWANRDYYNSVGGVQTSPTSPFNGTVGTGFGTLANRPTTCTAGTDVGGGSAIPGVAYWATDQNSGNGELYVCTATNTWTPYYTPYTYPHPLVSGTPSAPTNLRISGP